jgi:hypothetical protein
MMVEGRASLCDETLDVGDGKVEQLGENEVWYLSEKRPEPWSGEGTVVKATGVLFRSDDGHGGVANTDNDVARENN